MRAIARSAAAPDVSPFLLGPVFVGRGASGRDAVTERCHRVSLGSRVPLSPCPMTPSSLPVVFVHSLGGSPAQWRPQVERLTSPAIAVTLPGHAGADARPTYSVEALADAVVAQADGLDRFVVVGHSGGALVAAHVAATHPDRVAGLVLVDPGTDGRAFPREMAEPMLAALRSEAYPDVAAEHWGALLDGAADDTRALALADLAATDPEALPSFFESLGSYDAVTPIRAVAASRPVVAVVTPNSEGTDAVVSEADGAEVVHVDGTSHWVHLDRPDVVSDTVDRVLRQVEVAVAA